MYKKLDTPHALRGKAARRTAVFAAIVVAVLLGGFLGSTGAVRADLANTLTTTTAVAPGGTLTIAVTTAGVTIISSSLIAGCPTTGLNTATVTYTCSASGAGIAVVTAITQSFSAPTTPFSETVTYNANGPVAAVTTAKPASADAGTCAAPADSPGTSTCTTRTSAATVPAGTLVLTVTGAVRERIRIMTAPSTLGTCPLTTVLPTGTSDDADSETITYTCAAGQSVPSGASLSVTVQTAGSFMAPTVSASSNANAPVSAGAAVPTPSVQTVSVGARAPSLATIGLSSATGAGSNSSSSIGPTSTATGTVVVSPSGAGSNSSISIGPTSTATGTGVISSSGTEGTAALATSQSCVVNPAVCAAPATSQSCVVNPAICPLPPVTGVNGYCTAQSTSGDSVTWACRVQTTAATVGGGTLVLDVSVWPETDAEEVAEITAAPPPFGPCPLTSTTNPPIVSGPSVTLTYTCGASQSIPSGTNIGDATVQTSGRERAVTPQFEAWVNSNGSPTDPGGCAPLAGLPGSPGIWTCGVGTTVATQQGSMLELWLRQSTETEMVAIAAAPPSLGTCSLINPSLYPTEPGPSWLLKYVCDDGQSIPSGTDVGGVTVLTTGTGWASPPIFVAWVNILLAGPSLATIYPPVGPAGTSVTLTGDHLNGATGVSFGSTPATAFSCATVTSCTATAPPLSDGTAAQVWVTGAGGNGSNYLIFIYP